MERSLGVGLGQATSISLTIRGNSPELVSREVRQGKEDAGRGSQVDPQSLFPRRGRLPGKAHPVFRDHYELAWNAP